MALFLFFSLEIKDMTLDFFFFLNLQSLETEV